MASNGSFGGTDLGDYCWIVNPDIQFRQAVHEIPRASGVKIQDMGGGLKTLQVRVYKSSADKPTFISYFIDLIEGFGSAAAALIVDSVNLGSFYCRGASLQAVTKSSEYGYQTITFFKSV